MRVTPIQRAAALAHAASAGYRRRIAIARARIAEHPDYAVAVSWGKDSVVLLDLAVATNARAIAIHARYSRTEEFPDLPAVRDALLARYGRAVTYAEVAMPGEWEIFERVGHAFTSPATAEERAAWREWQALFTDRMDAAALHLGCAGSMLGLASHESRARALNRAVRGTHYHAAGRAIPTLLPLSDLRAEDVIAYHQVNALPWLHIYDSAEDPRRARSEVCLLAADGASEAIRRHGAWVEWARAYPEWWRVWKYRWGLCA